MKDCLGTPIEVGQVITYPYRRGSYMVMKTAVVRSVRPEEVDVQVFETTWGWDEGNHRYGYYTRPYQTTIYRVDRATVTPLTEEQLRERLS